MNTLDFKVHNISKKWDSEWVVGYGRVNMRTNAL